MSGALGAQNMNWISLSDRFPKPETPVYVCGRDGQTVWQSVAKYHPRAAKEWDRWEAVGLDEQYEGASLPYPWVPTHWAPLHNPPETKKETE